MINEIMFKRLHEAALDIHNRELENPILSEVNKFIFDACKLNLTFTHNNMELCDFSDYSNIRKILKTLWNYPKK